MPIPHYLRRAASGLLIAAAIFLAVPFLIRLYDPTAGSFGADLLNALALAALLFSGAMHMGLYGYEKFFPRFQSYQAESLEGEGKLFENLTDPLDKTMDLCAARVITMEQYLPINIERRKIAQFKFLIRCVRLSFCLLCLAYLLHLAMQALSLAMTAVPGSAPAL